MFILVLFCLFSVCHWNELQGPWKLIIRQKKSVIAFIPQRTTRTTNNPNNPLWSKLFWLWVCKLYKLFDAKRGVWNTFRSNVYLLLFPYSSFLTYSSLQCLQMSTLQIKYSLYCFILYFSTMVWFRWKTYEISIAACVMAGLPTVHLSHSSIHSLIVKSASL